MSSSMCCTRQHYIWDADGLQKQPLVARVSMDSFGDLSHSLDTGPR
jgi:hypothetical protein